jgi:hypothetical protein
MQKILRRASTSNTTLIWRGGSIPVDAAVVAAKMRATDYCSLTRKK